MARGRRLRSALATLGALLAAALSAGCVSMPSGGPVQSYPVTQQAADAQAQPFIQVQPPSPRPGWSPGQIVQGFLIASASFGAYGQVAQQYLTPDARKTWKPNWSAVVYKRGPNVTEVSYSPAAKNATRATVYVGGTVQASLKGSGSYSVPQASSQGAASDEQGGAYQIGLRKVKGGQWRISKAPPVLLLTSNAFKSDYQLRNLYFFDPMGKYLVPDPIYVPLSAGLKDLVNGLVRDLKTQPADWLSGGFMRTAPATKTAFPDGTKISSVNLDGVTAVVNLTGSITKADTAVMERLSAQLWATLHGGVQGGPNGQTVQSIEVLRNGQPWAPPGKSGSAIQQPPYIKYAPALAHSTTFYYVDGAGYLNSRSNTFDKPSKPKRLAKIGTGYTQLAVSPDGMYVAAVRDNVLYAGLIGRPLVKQGTGCLAVSWDENDTLWASLGSRIVMFRGSPHSRQPQPLGQMVPVNVHSDSDLVTPPFTLLKVAPDGVRVAIVQSGNALSTLTFGAISGQQGPSPQIWLSTVQETPQTPLQPNPVSANFTSLAWYDADHVITLADPGPAVTMYPVSGGSPTPIPTDPGMNSITVSYKQPLIAGLANGQMASDPGLTGSWTAIDDVNGAPTKGSVPVYPG